MFIIDIAFSNSTIVAKRFFSIDRGNIMQCNAMQYNAIQYNTTQHNTMQYNTIQQRDRDFIVIA